MRDRCPRTLHEAFGPYAELEVEHKGPTFKGYAVSIVIALLIGFVSWAVNQ